MFDGPEGSWIWPGDAPSHFVRLVCAGLGVLVGMAVMTAVVLVTMPGPPAGPALPSPGILTVGGLTSYCSGCTPGGPCNLNGPAAGFCLGVITCVMDIGPGMGRLCLPQDWGTKDSESLFMAWSRNHPEDQDMPAVEGIIRAHAASFDCRKSGGGV